MPWHTFVFAEGTDSTVKVFFHSHTVFIDGSGLSALLDDLANQQVIAVTEPGRTAKFRQSTGPLITAVSVMETE